MSNNRQDIRQQTLNFLTSLMPSAGLCRVLMIRVPPEHGKKLLFVSPPI
jgi:hypothetical protein